MKPLFYIPFILLSLATALQAEGPAFLELKGHTNDVYSASFSPDGKTIVTASRDNTARIWDAETEKELPRLEGWTVQKVGFATCTV